MVSRMTILATVVTATLVATAHPSHADEVHVATATQKWDKQVSEDQCLDKAKAALKAGGYTSHLGPMGTHSYAGGKADFSVVIDCLSYVGANAVHVSVATVNKKSDDLVNVMVALTNALK